MLCDTGAEIHSNQKLCQHSGLQGPCIGNRRCHEDRTPTHILVRYAAHLKQCTAYHVLYTAALRRPATITWSCYVVAFTHKQQQAYHLLHLQLQLSSKPRLVTQQRFLPAAHCLSSQTHLQHCNSFLRLQGRYIARFAC